MSILVKVGVIGRNVRNGHRLGGMCPQNSQSERCMSMDDVEVIGVTSEEMAVLPDLLPQLEPLRS